MTPETERGKVRLKEFRAGTPSVSVSAGKKRLWRWANALIVMNSLNPSSRLRVMVLRAFGATIGSGTQIRDKVNISQPWHLEIGNDTWIGEGVWIDSLAPVLIGSNVCISQQAYLCCGNHDWTSPYFDTRFNSITVEDGAWIAAKTLVMGGVTIGSHAVLTGGSVASKSLPEYQICSGNPAVAVKERKIVEPSP